MSEAQLAQVDGLPLARLDDWIWVGDIPARGAQQCAERDALVYADAGQHLSYAQLDQACDSLVALLHSRGIGAGDRIAYLGRNNDLYFVVLLGAIRAGVVLVPLNWRLAAPELAYQLEDSEARLLIHDQELAALSEQASTGLPVQKLLTEDHGESPGLRSLLRKPSPRVPAPHKAEQIVLQLYTSGTTGKPKGVLISHGALSAARHAERIAPALQHLRTECRTLSAMPNFHVGGMSWVLMGLIRQGSVVITADATPAGILRLLRAYQIEHTFIVPTVLRAIVDSLLASGEAAPRMQGIHYGAMAMDSQLLRQTMTLFNCAFVQYFGMTENTGSATLLAPEDHDLGRPGLLRSVGKPYPGMSLQIRDAQQRPVACGQHGEIWIKSPTAMAGYWKLPDKTAEVVQEGWYASGDGGYLNEQGYLFLTDRIKDMIVSGGENVYPVEVEEALRQHRAVLDAAVVGLRDARWGEKVVAVLELREGLQVQEAELLEYLRTRIAAYKCPKQILFAPLPRTASGKVRRAQLRQRLMDAGTG